MRGNIAVRAPIVVIVCGVVMAACVGTPPPSRVAAARKAEASQVADMQRFGYTIKDKNGQKLYCQKEVKTGSHLQTTTACLTEAQWMRVNLESQSRLEDITRQSTSLPNNPGH
jgi:hypothetical protein